MKFSQYMSYYKRKKMIKNFYKKSSSRLFYVCKELISIGKSNFWNKLLILICNSKAIKICSNQHADLLRSIFREDSLKIKKGLELVFRPYFPNNFLIKKFPIAILHKLAKFHYQTVFPVSFLGIWWCHDIWISEKLKFDYLKKEKRFQSEIKNIFPCFTSALH